MNVLERFNQIVKTTNTVDFEIQSFNSVNLVITGSFDFSYYHELEIHFGEVSYISLPTDFSYPVFRMATEDEVVKLRKLVYIDDTDFVYCIEAETSCSLEKLRFFVIAEGISLQAGMVYYYQRENLKE